jgi:hypothetical protein
MLGWNKDDWKNWMGHRGVPGLVANAQQTLGGMMGGMFPQFGGGGDGGDPTNLAELLSMMNRQGGQQSGQGGSYLGGQGFI